MGRSIQKICVTLSRFVDLEVQRLLVPIEADMSEIMEIKLMCLFKELLNQMNFLKLVLWHVGDSATIINVLPVEFWKSAIVYVSYMWALKLPINGQA